jgi:isopenicillin-N epimerase
MNPFKSQFMLDPTITFLNHGSFGATPIPVFEIYQSWQKRLEHQPVLFLGREYHNLLFQAREVLSSIVGANISDIVFVPNATYAVNLIARSLKLSPGDEILASDHEYGACDFTWQFFCQKQGAAYHKQSISFPSDSFEEIAEQFWRGVNEKTKLIFLSHITSPTALRLPIEMICAKAQKAGILTFIDGAHAPGQIPLNLKTLQADFYTGNCHKWMLSPKGAGFFYAHPRSQHLIEPLIVSWGIQIDPVLSSGSKFVDMLTWTGTHDPAAYLSVTAAIQFMHSHNWTEISRNCHEKLTTFLPVFSSVTGKDHLYKSEHQYGQMAAIEIPKLTDCSGIKNALYDEFQIEIPVIEWNQRHFLRISYQGYNEISDLEKLYTALKDLIPRFKKIKYSPQY